MTSAAMAYSPPMDWPRDRLFAQSESKAVGLHGNLMDTLHDNAPRIVGGLKMVGDIAAGLTMHPFMIAYASLSVVGRIIVMAYGTKENQRKVAAEAQAQGQTQKLSNSLPDSLRKVMQPKQYPVESSAGFSTVAEVFETGYGVAQFTAGKTGFTPTILGALAIWSYANILFGKEGKSSEEAESKDAAGAGSTSLVFANSESKTVGFVGRIRRYMKDNPVVVSSLMQLGITIGMLIGGIVEGLGTAYIAYGVIGVIANSVQALLVRKKEFNIEGAQESMKSNPAERAQAQPTESATFEERFARNRNETGPQLA